MSVLKLKACARCGGDLHLDDTDWQCLQCGRYYYGSTPWSYLRRREGAWGNSKKVSGRRDGLERKRPKNKSVLRVANVQLLKGPWCIALAGI